MTESTGANWDLTKNNNTYGNFSTPKKNCEMTVTAHLEVHIVIWRKKCATKKYYFDFSIHVIVFVKSQSAVVDDVTNFQLLTWACC